MPQSSYARAPQLLKPVPRARAPQQEKPPQWEAHALQLEKARAQQQRPNAAKKKKKEKKEKTNLGNSHS